MLVFLGSANLLWIQCRVPLAHSTALNGSPVDGSNGMRWDVNGKSDLGPSRYGWLPSRSPDHRTRNKCGNQSETLESWVGSRIWDIILTLVRPNAAHTVDRTRIAIFVGFDPHCDPPDTDNFVLIVANRQGRSSAVG